MGDDRNAWRAVQITRASKREIFTYCSIDGLPAEVANDISRDGSITPHGVRLRLAGLELEPFTEMNDADLESLRDSLAGVADAVRIALQSAKKHLELDENDEVINARTSDSHL
jgi:hypothetical protein